MKKTEHGLISNSIIIAKRNTGKLNASIDYFVRCLELIANDDKVVIKTIYHPNTEMLEIHSYYGKFVFSCNVKSKMILANINNIKRFANFVYEGIKKQIIEYFEYIELIDKYEEKDEDKVDEHWEFVDIGSI